MIRFNNGPTVQQWRNLLTVVFVIYVYIAYHTSSPINQYNCRTLMKFAANIIARNVQGRISSCKKGYSSALITTHNCY